MSLAPADFSAGISVLTLRFGTTVSTAFMSPRASAVMVGDDSAGSMSVTALSWAAGTLSLLRRSGPARQTFSLSSFLKDENSVSEWPGARGHP